MPYNVFRSDDAGAPAHNSNAGGMIPVLDACLVNGYNSKTITITRTGSTATATNAGHGFRDHHTVNISGAGQAEYNGDFKITNVTANTFDFTVSGAPQSPATGTITARVAALGWTKPFSGTNKAAYRMAPPLTSGGRFFLRIDDQATTARTRGYETMSDVDTGTGLFPTEAISSGGYHFRKAASADATSRPWILWGNERGFHFSQYGNVSGTDLTPNSSGYDSNTSAADMYFGAFRSRVPNDPFNVVLLSGTTNSIGKLLGSPGSGAGTANGWLCVARDYQGLLAKTLATTWLGGGLTTGSNGSANHQFPSAINGRLEFAHDILMTEVDQVAKFGPRGTLPGRGFVFGDLISGTRRYWDTFTDQNGWRYLAVPTGSGGTLATILVRVDAAHPTWAEIL